MLKSIMLALSILVITPLAAQASEITLIPAVKLQIGDQDHNGNYWDGGHWRDHGWWGDHYEWRDNRWHQHDHHDDHRGDRHDNGNHDKDHHNNGNHGDDWKHH